MQKITYIVFGEVRTWNRCRDSYYKNVVNKFGESKVLLYPSNQTDSVSVFESIVNELGKEKVTHPQPEWRGKEWGHFNMFYNYFPHSFENNYFSLSPSLAAKNI